MLIVGAKGHALEILQCLTIDEREKIVFFDDVTRESLKLIEEKYALIRTIAEAQAYLAEVDSRFVLGIGNPVLRQRLAIQFRKWGGTLTSVIASSSVIGPDVASFGDGLNLMHHTLVAPNVWLGEGVLLNAGAAVHHDVRVGEYCEISPGARLLGRCHLGSYCRVGASAVVLPDVVLGDGAIIGAGAVVTRDVSAGITVVGIPARPLTDKKH